MPTIYLNDTSLEDLGLVLIEGGPALGAKMPQRERQPWPGRAGALPSPVGTVEPRVLRFVTDAPVASVSARTALLDYYSDLLTGLLEIRYADAPDRVMRGTCSVFDATIPAPPSWVNLDPRIVVEIECFNAAKWDAQPIAKTIGATPVPIPCGTLPHGGILTVTGAAAGALSGETRLRYRGISGVVLGELILSPSLLAGEGLVIDLDETSLTRVSTTGVLTNVYGWKTGGQWFRVYHRDGVRSLGAFPTLELTNGAVARYEYRRNYRR